MKYRALYEGIEGYRDEASANTRRTTHLTELNKEVRRLQQEIKDLQPDNYLREAEIQADTAKNISKQFKKEEQS